MKWIWFIFIFLAACTKNQLNTADESALQSDLSYYLGGSADIRIFYVTNDSEPGLFVTKLVPQLNTNLVPIPKSVYNGDYNDRSWPGTPQNLDLITRVYRYQPVPSGDFYFESPVLGPQIEISNVTTALSWILRWGFGNYRVSINQNTFLNLLRTVELRCDQCRTKTNSQVVDFILGSQDLAAKILQLVQDQNPTLTSTKIEYAPPSRIFAASQPNLYLNGTLMKEVTETSKISLKVLALDPKNSVLAEQPMAWIRTFNETSSRIETTTLEIEFSYDDSGQNQFQPEFKDLLYLGNLSYIYDVTDLNRKPFCDDPINLTVYSNRSNEIDLNGRCRDPDIEDAVVSFSLVNGPAGLSISSNGTLRWTPPQALDNLAYSLPLTFLVSDSKLGFQEVLANLTVEADHLPILTARPLNPTFSEGLSSTYQFSASDSDGDALILRITAVDPISAELPDGAGLLSSFVRAGTDGNYQFDWSFTPSWMQTIGSDSNPKVKVSIYYDALTQPNLDGSIELYSEILTLSIINTDDPPHWTVQPTDFTATEALDFAMTFVGTAVDSALNPTAISYSIESSPSLACSWITGAGFVVTSAGSAYLNQAPPYNANETCIFNLVARDAQGLVSRSNSFEITFNDVNQPISIRGGAPTLYTIDEMRPLSIDLAEIYLDLDYEEQDPRELFSYTCLWDSDSDTIYESPCDAPSGPNLGFSSLVLNAYWTPSAVSAGLYPIRLTITDHGTTQATHDFSIQVNQAPAPMLLDISVDAVNPMGSLSANENSEQSFYIRARAATAEPIDQYSFKILTPTCSVVGGGTCPGTLIATPITNTGYSDTDLIYKVTTSFNDGNNPLPSSAKKYFINLTLQKSDDVSLETTLGFELTVNNTNRPPTGLGLSSGSFGCTGSSGNTDPGTFTICIDASKDTKVGGRWQKSYKMNLSKVDPDNNNDEYSYSLIESYAPEGISGALWSFKLPTCVNSGTSTITRYVNLQVSDGRGGALNREVQLRIQKASTSGPCLQ